jgi:membrane protein DedA with SNARE-associated domain
MAGMGKMAKKPFIIAGFLGRSLRFGLEAVLIGLYGQQALDAMMWFLDREVLLAVVCIAGILMTWFMWQWWSNLGEDDATTGA